MVISDLDYLQELSTMPVILGRGINVTIIRQVSIAISYGGNASASNSANSTQLNYSDINPFESRYFRDASNYLPKTCAYNNFA